MSQPQKLKISQAIIVEGHYDKMRLEECVDALIVPTHGFSIFTDTKRKNFIRKIAEQKGIIVLTDSDAAGFKIRGFLKGIVPPEQIKDVFIPDIMGKEKRKTQPSQEGKLGVEGISCEILQKAFEKAGVTLETEEQKPFLTQAILYRDGLYGGADSNLRRKKLFEAVGLPEHTSVKAALPILNTMLTEEEYVALINEL